MVLLTMTRSIVEALEKVQSLQRSVVEETIREGNFEDHGDSTPVSFNNVDIGDEKQISDLRRDSPSTGESPAGSLLEISPNASTKPGLNIPKEGNPISHNQVIALWRSLKSTKNAPFSLEGLLRGAQVYSPPPPPRAEPVRYAASSNANVLITSLDK